MTVRQIFSDEPAKQTQADLLASAVAPFYCNGCLALLPYTHGHRASIMGDSVAQIITQKILPVKLKYLSAVDKNENVKLKQKKK